MRIEDTIYEKLHEYLGLDEKNINILEETIDSNTQVEYFEFTRNYKNSKPDEEILYSKNILFNPVCSIEEKKATLVELASLNNAEAFRIIETYVNLPNTELHEWACLALQECKLQLETNLLEENKVLITTGLGGKGLKLRYFIVLLTPDESELTPIQQNIIRNELNFFLPKHGAELEDLIFENGFASLLAIIPIKVQLQKLFKSIIQECNQMGNFLYNDFIITNMKAMHTEEIRELLRISNIY